MLYLCTMLKKTNTLIMKQKILKYSILSAITIVIVLFAVCEGFLRYALMPEDNNHSTKVWVDSVRTCGALRDTFIMNNDGDSLHGWYVRAKVPTEKTAILIHGYGDNGLWMGHIASIYDSLLHYNILMPDLHSFGKSQGKWVQMGWKDRLDVLLWCKIAEQMFGAKDIVLHGVSMGAATVMCVGGEPLPSSVRCIIEDCGYTSVWDEFRNQLDEQFGLPPFPLLYLASALCKIQLGWSFGEASPLSQVAKCKVPMLFIHGGNDTYVRTEMVHRLYAAKKGQKALWIAPGSGHARSIDDHPSEYAKQVETFCDKYMLTN